MTCLKMGVTEEKPINFEEYYERYDLYYNWYDFFNSPHHKSSQDKLYQYRHSTSADFKIDQVEEYIKLMHNEIEALLYQFKGESKHIQNRIVPSDQKNSNSAEKDLYQLVPKNCNLKAIMATIIENHCRILVKNSQQFSLPRLGDILTFMI